MFPSQWRKLWEMTKQFMSAFETFFACLRYHKGHIGDLNPKLPNGDDSEKKNL